MENITFQVTHPDFKKAKEKVMFKKKEGVPEGLYMWQHLSVLTYFSICIAHVLVIASFIVTYLN